MPSNFENCVETAVASGLLDRDAGEDILGKFRSDAKYLGLPKAEELGEIAWRSIAKIARQDRALSHANEIQHLKDYAGFTDWRGRTNLRMAMQSKFESMGFSGYPGVKQVGETYIGIFNSMMADALEKFSRTFISGRRQNANLMVELRKALHGETVSPEFKELGKTVAEAMEWLRVETNKYGGHIPKREDWGNPQIHDENAVGNAGRIGHNGGPPIGARPRSNAEHNKIWRDFINPLLAWEKMHDPVTGELFDMAGLSEERKESILKHSWESIVSEGRNDLIPRLRPQGLGFGGARSEHRFFVFKGAEAQEKYDREYGKGDVFTQIMSWGHSMAREIALKKVFGPNPPARIEWMKQEFKAHIGHAIAGRPNQLGYLERKRRGRSAANLLNKEARFLKLLDNYYDQFRGESPTSNTLSIAATIIGNDQMGALLGSSVIPHGTSNWYIQMLERKMLGMPMMRTIPSLLSSFGKATHGEMLRAGLSIEDGAFNVGHAARQLAAWHKIANASRVLPDRTTTWSGLMAVVNANKASFQKDLTGFVADHVHLKWSALPARLRSKMAGYGMDERGWRVMQLAKLYDPSLGAAVPSAGSNSGRSGKWIRWKEIAEVGLTNPEEVLRIYGSGLPLVDPKTGGLYTESLERAASDALAAALDFQNFLHGEREIAVPQSSPRARAFMIGKSDKSEPIGFMRGSGSQFKGFISSMMLSQIQTTQREFARGWQHGMAHLAYLFIGLTMMGMVSYQLKQMAAGKDPVNMNPLTREGVLAWAHAALTGGSFGIFGDLLASERDSYGHGWAETLMGPAVNLPMDLAMGAKDVVSNALFSNKQTKVPMSVAFERALIKVVRNNMPVLTTHFLTRAAYQRIFADQVEYHLDPDANKNFKDQEHRTYKDTGQTYWWRPGEMRPDHAPDLSRLWRSR